MASWTDEEINAALADLGLRTPGRPLPPNPERIVAGELLTARERVQELTQQVLETNTLYERTREDRDRLIPMEDERNNAQQEVENLKRTLGDVTKTIETYQHERDVAFDMVRDLEVKVRTLQAQVGQQP